MDAAIDAAAVDDAGWRVKAPREPAAEALVAPEVTPMCEEGALVAACLPAGFASPDVGSNSEFNPSERVGREAAAAIDADPSGVIVGGSELSTVVRSPRYGVCAVVMRRALDEDALGVLAPWACARTSFMDTRFEIVEVDRALRVVTGAYGS